MTKPKKRRAKPNACPVCKGTGREQVHSFADSSKMVERSCHVCHGTGSLDTTRPITPAEERVIRAAVDLHDAQELVDRACSPFGRDRAIDKLSEVQDVFTRAVRALEHERAKAKKGNP